MPCFTTFAACTAVFIALRLIFLSKTHSVRLRNQTTDMILYRADISAFKMLYLLSSLIGQSGNSMYSMVVIWSALCTPLEGNPPILFMTILYPRPAETSLLSSFRKFSQRLIAYPNSFIAVSMARFRCVIFFSVAPIVSRDRLFA